MTPTITRWDGCYRDGWQDLIVPEAFAHPAKYSRGLIHRIYRHLLARGYVRPGQTVLDPFAGVGLGALDAMTYGLAWIGCELEPRFHALAEQNLALWHRRYGFTGGTVAQGDSRQLRSVLAGTQTGCVVGSPPFSQPSCQPPNARNPGGKYPPVRSRWAESPDRLASFGDTPGQLGALPPGTPPACVVGSPPFLSTDGGDRPASTADRHITAALFQRHGASRTAGYGTTPGQLGALPPGTPPDALVSSPPYAGAGQVLGTHNGIDYSKVQGSGKAATPARIASGEGYGVTPGQLGNMPAAIGSSPPYADTIRPHDEGPGMAGNARQRAAIAAGSPTQRAAMTGRHGSDPGGYGRSAGQLGAMPAGAVVSSPPWESSDPRTQGTGAMPRAKRSASSLLNNPTCQFGQSISGEAYGTSAGQLGAMPAGAIVGSPPWENQEPSHAQGDSRCFGTGGQTYKDSTYGTSPDQLGNATGDTFWSAADAVMREVSALLPVGGIACWVLKGYVSKGRLVNFPAQWLALCQAHGFTLLEEIHASLIEESGVQETLFGEAERVQVERKSFFRRLHEKRPGAVRIDHETVLILRKEA